MKPITERKIPQSLEQRNSLTKFIIDTKEHKLQSRQQQIVNIVKNAPVDGVNKINASSSKTVRTPSDNSYSSSQIYKVKTSSSKPNTLIQKEIQKDVLKSSKLNKTDPVLKKYGLNSRETLNWLDKHYVRSSYSKDAGFSKDLKLKDIRNKSNNLEKRKIPNLNELIKSDDRSSESKTNTNESDEGRIESGELKLKLNQKDINCSDIQKAIQDVKVFLIRADIPYLDKILQKRGWVKKYETAKTRHLAYGSFPALDPTSSLNDINGSDNSQNEKIISQELRDVFPDFIWDCRNDFVQWKGYIKPETYLNRLEKSVVYTSKLGLALFLDKFYWFFEKDVSDVLYPRSYNITDEKEAFIDDYRKTAAVSFVRWFVEQVERNSDAVQKNFYSTWSSVLRFAIERCEEIISEHYENILDETNNAKQISSKEWDWFIDNYINCVHQKENKEKFTTASKRDGDDYNIVKLYEKSVNLIQTIKFIDAQFELNGIRNIWILKPNMSCCGYGIMMTHKLNNILAKAEESSKNHFLVQKYIETPLLVKNTKFDVRHWFLVTKSYPLTIWVYKESLLRFSSRPFTFDHYHEIVHICNTAVQRKYSDQKNPVRTLNWNCEMLNSYLKEYHPDATGEPWHDIIYPRMCQAIVAVMLAAQNNIDTRENSFELYGADFVIMNDLSVWLIEINTNPRMHPPSSPITERLYPDVLESLIKVIFDYPQNPEADTGNFVLLYEQNVESLSFNDISELSIDGQKIDKDDIERMDTVLDQMEIIQNLIPTEPQE